MTDEPRFDIRQGSEFSYCQGCPKQLRSHPPPIQFVPTIFTPGIPQQVRETDRYISSGAEMKNKWTCSYRPTYTLMVNLFLIPG
jgi:hypothetical protein